MPAFRIDEIDEQIIDLLLVDGRMSCSEISAAIGHITERSVRYRLTRLLDNQIIQISAIISPSAIGFNVIADVFIQVDPGHVREIAQLLVEREEVSYVACSTGEVDISIQIVANSNESVFDFVTNVIGKIPGVRKTTTSVVPIILKDVYRWRVPNAVIKSKD
jgi:Lrp/AsnC family transcriptional regulator for asnA, asnC and gidA